GPFGDLSRHRICGALPAQAQGRDRRGRRPGRFREHSHSRCRPDRPYRRRQDFRTRPLGGDPHPHRRDRRGRPLSVFGEKQMKIDKLIGGAALASLLLALPAFAQDAAAPAAEVVEEVASIDTGDTAWMIVSTLLVIMMTIPGVA